MICRKYLEIKFIVLHLHYCNVCYSKSDCNKKKDYI